MAAPGAAPPRLALALAVVAALVAVKYYRDSEAARRQVTEGARRGEAVPGAPLPLSEMAGGHGGRAAEGTAGP